MLSVGNANASFSQGTCALGDVTAGVTLFGSTQCDNFTGNNNNYQEGSGPKGFEYYINASFGLDDTLNWAFAGDDKATGDIVTGSGGAQSGTWAVTTAIDAFFVVTVKAGSYFAAYLFESGTGILGGEYSVSGATTKDGGGTPADLSHVSVYTSSESGPISFTAAVPLPAGGLLLLSGLGGLGLFGRLRRNRRNRPAA